jgi:maleylpyruvate isomerase
MELEPHVAITLCIDAHRRLWSTAKSIDDETARQPSRLPGWTIGHVLTHIARNADGHVRGLEGALRGEEVPRYAGGSQQRDGEIDEGAMRTANALARDVEESARRLEETWSRSDAAGWPNADLFAGDRFPTTGSPLRRLREVEVHHVDLVLGYEVTDWPEEYVEWELPTALARLPERLPRAKDRHLLLGWLIGRRASTDDIELRPWM